MPSQPKTRGGSKQVRATDLHLQHQIAATQISPDASQGPVYFWREWLIPFGFLCQWYPSPFTISYNELTVPLTIPLSDDARAVCDRVCATPGQIKFHTTEMYMMVNKAVLFNDLDALESMLRTSNPASHKRLGQEVRKFDETVWDEWKDKIVEAGCDFKFSRGEIGEELGRWLMVTGQRELVEASPYDRVWGIGFAADRAEANRGAWGENRLGIALNRVRTRLVMAEMERQAGPSFRARSN